MKKNDFFLLACAALWWGIGQNRITGSNNWTLAVPAGFPESDTIPFVTFNDNIGPAGQTETRRLFKSASTYKNYFGHAAPSTVNYATEWVFFYSAGTKNTGGYSASISKILLSPTGITLKITTSLSSPGSGCMVTQALTKPFILVKFKRPHTVPAYLQFYKNDQVRKCQ